MGKIVTLSFDDGNRNDEKVAEIMLRYKIKGAFYLNFLKAWPAITPLPSFFKGFPESLEIGSHGLIHDDLRILNEKTLEKYVGRKPYNDFLGREIRMFAPPWGYYNDKVIKSLKKEGYMGSRTSQLDFSYSYPQDFFRIKISLYPHKIPTFLKFKQSFERFLKGDGKLFHMATHSLGTANFNDFEEICKYIQASEAESLTNFEVLKRISKEKK